MLFRSQSVVLQQHLLAGGAVAPPGGLPVIEVPSLGSGTSTLKATDSYNEYAVRGGFFRVNYNYKDRYLLEVNGRYFSTSLSLTKQPWTRRGLPHPMGA